MSRRKITSLKVVRPKPAGLCRKQTSTGTSLAALVEEYRRDYVPVHRALLNEYRHSKSLDKAIKNAAGLTGPVPDHERRVGRRVLNKASQRLVTHQRQITNCDSFDSLFRLVERVTADIHRFGELAVYDTSLRLGVWLRKWPKKVYLHAGPRRGARALGLDTSRGYIEMHDLPTPIQKLKPWQAEDFLCIYEDEFRRVRGC